MTKRDELTQPKSCMARALAEEMTFVLLARDEAAPLAIRAWVKARIERGKNRKNDKQTREALACANAMEAQRDSIREALASQEGR